MSDTPDPLDADLMALRPRGVSPDLRRRVAERLARPPIHRGTWAIATAGVLALAAGLVFVAWLRHGPVPTGVETGEPGAIESKFTPPTLAAFRQALARSPEDLSALLDRSGATGLNTETEKVPVGVVPRFSASFEALLGGDS